LFWAPRPQAITEAVNLGDQAQLLEGVARFAGHDAKQPIGGGN
jgi:hypothetical protein